MTSIFVFSWYLLVYTISLSYGNRIPPRYTINLDLAPENRWDKIIDDHKKFLPAVIEEINHYVPKLLRPVVWWIDENILLERFPEEYAREMRGIAARSGLRIGEVVGMNILYDITAFSRKHILANIGCTSIVAEDRNGRIIHGRNLDFDMTSLLRNMTIIADFTKGGNLLLYYKSGYVPGKGMAHFQSVLMSAALEEKNTFEEAKELLMNEHFIAPSYLIIAGTKAGEGCIITRDRWKTADLKCIDAQKDQWFLVVTNFDYWKVDKDKRRKTAEKALRSVGRQAITDKKMLRILSIHPVENNLTVFSTVMSPLDQRALYVYTVIQE